jgi:hypothetical protein
VDLVLYIVSQQKQYVAQEKYDHLFEDREVIVPASFQSFGADQESKIKLSYLHKDKSRKLVASQHSHSQSTDLQTQEWQKYCV